MTRLVPVKRKYIYIILILREASHGEQVSMTQWVKDISYMYIHAHNEDQYTMTTLTLIGM